MFSLFLNGNYSDSKKNCLSTKVFCGFISIEESFCAVVSLFLFFYLARIQWLTYITAFLTYRRKSFISSPSFCSLIVYVCIPNLIGSNCLLIIYVNVFCTQKWAVFETKQTRCCYSAQVVFVLIADFLFYSLRNVRCLTGILLMTFFHIIFLW